MNRDRWTKVVRKGEMKEGKNDYREDGRKRGVTLVGERNSRRKHGVRRISERSELVGLGVIRCDKLCILHYTQFHL